MSQTKVTGLKNAALSLDGRQATINLATENGNEVSFEIETLQLATLAHELGHLVMKSREFSEIRKQNVVQFMRPRQCRAVAIAEESTVLISFILISGSEHNYGLDLDSTNKLIEKMREAVEYKNKDRPIRAN